MDEQQNDNITSFRHNIEGRVGRLEGAVETLVKEVEQTSSDVRMLVNRFNDFGREVSNEIGKATTPKWPLIASIGSLVTVTMMMAATLIAFIFSGQSERINDNRENIVKLVEKQEKIEYNHGRMDEWKEGVSKDIMSLDVNLQREMRLLNEIINEKVENLDKKIQHEFNNTLSHHQSDIDMLKEWQLKHSINSSENFGELKGKINASSKIH